MGDVGYAQTTTRAVAAGVAEGTFYRHFPDTASLLIAAAMERAAPVVERMSRLPARTGHGTVEGNLTQCLSELVTPSACSAPDSSPDAGYRPGDSRGSERPPLPSSRCPGIPT